MLIQQHYKKLNFDIVSMIVYDVILKMFWLKRHNLKIDWKKWVFILKDCSCITDNQSTH